MGLLSLRMLVRDWRSGELRVLAGALILAVAGITSVGFFTDRVRLALERQAGDLLGADLVVTSSRPVSDAVSGAAAEAGLRRARTVEFPSMALGGGASALVTVKAVSDGYPLRGAVRIGAAAFGADRVADGLPAAGGVWVESRLLQALGVGVGDTLSLGDAGFRIEAVLVSDPLSGGGLLFGVAPRALIGLDDLEATGLLGPGSRVRYRELFAGAPAEVAAFRARADGLLAPGERIEGVEDAQPQVRTALDRARSFLALAALVSVLLAGVAVALSARRFVTRHLDGCAVMRCLGARQSTILRLFGFQLLWLGVLAALAGSALGYGAQAGLEVALGEVVGMELPAPSARPLLLGLGTALVTLLGFALPPLLHLRGVPALRVMRRELGGMTRAGVSVYLAGITAIAALVFWHSPDPALGVRIVLGTVVALAVLALLAAGLLVLLKAIHPRLGPSWRFGLLAVTRRPGTALIQVMAFGLGIAVLLLLMVVRGDLLAQWEGGLPEDAPNRFLINVQPGQVEPLRSFFANRGQPDPQLLPMVRGRLVAIGGDPVAPESYYDERAQNLVRREFNLSWAEAMQDDNRIVAGRWWTPGEHGEPVVSVEEGLARTLGIGLGDRLTFDVSGAKVEVEVSSLRTVEWDSFRVNFFVIAPPGVIDDQPATYISSLYVPAGEHGLLDDLVRRFPNVTVLDVAAIMEHVRGIMDRVAAAVEYVFLFTLLAGLLVMYAAIHATLDERIRETVLMRTLGAARGQIVRGLAAEFVALGLIAGVAAAAIAAVLGHQVSTRVLDLAYVPGPALWLIGALAGAFGVGAAGLLGTRFILRAPPLKALRESL